MKFGASAPLGPEPIEGIEVTKPPWPFPGLFPIENTLGTRWLLPASVVPFLLLLAVPLVDRSPDRDPRKRRLVIIGFAVGLGVFIALTILGALVPVQAHVGG